VVNRLRQSNIDKLREQPFDVLIIGGGINGAVSAASLSARGLKVALIDRGDFASGVSSNSSNLAWGGIKYLESFEFLLVNKLCKSRNLLMRTYPSTVQEIRFFTTIARGFRMGSFLVYLGSVLYWLMGRCVTRAPSFKTSAGLERSEPIINTENAAGGLEYSDCYLYDNDARFVFNFIRKSLNYGCIATNYVSALSSEETQAGWSTRVRDEMSGDEFDVRARVIVNAAGPWADGVNSDSKQQTLHQHVFSKGIHLVVPQVTDNKRVLTFFASDGRLFFLIPMGPKTCIGTTDEKVENPEVVVTDADRDFVLENANKLLDLDPPLCREDIIAERVGVRPLAVTDGGAAADWVQLSRKHALDVDSTKKHITIFGGKLTDCLNVGDEIAETVAGFGLELPHPDQIWYGEPGAEMRRDFMHQARLMSLDELTDSSSSEPLSLRFWRRYGETAFGLLERIREDPSQAQLLIENAEYTRCEIELAARREMIAKLEDFMRRRSKIELVVRKEDIRKAPGLREACEILFAEQAEEKLAEYLSGLN
jgi:glycerol-3-phosphate dehydrogenase